MEVIILADGLGTCMRSEVKDVPKCMVAPVARKKYSYGICIKCRLIDGLVTAAR